MPKKFYLLLALTLTLVASAFALWCVNKKTAAPVLTPQPGPMVTSSEKGMVPVVENNGGQGNDNLIQSVTDLVDDEYTFRKVDISNWKSYRDENAGFEVLIPKDWFCGGVALAPNLVSQRVCLEEKEKENYYNGKYMGHNLIMFNKLDSEIDPLRERLEFEKKKKAKIYVGKVNNELVFITVDKNYTHVFDPVGKWMLIKFPLANEGIFDSFVLNFKYIQ